ncbi:MAG: hypothetical protein H6728_05495 [Myxococcales bacterium]|nr:hypothetical protein [Myxococcales bacterium]MCB9642510.1 hypothetical protein [Myxococcales bacterium]
MSIGFFIRLCVFGAIFWMGWTAANLEPNGDLSFYLLPFILFSIPVLLLSSGRSLVEAVLNRLLTVALFGMWVWSAVWYFKYPQFGYSAVSLLAGLILLSIPLWLAWFRKRQESFHADKAILLATWIVGLVMLIGLLGMLVYYIGFRKASPEASSSILVAVGTFLFFLAITIVRLFWMDDARNRRAMRIDHVPRSDALLLLEWFIPQSMYLVIMIPCLIFAEALLFDTVYRFTRRPQEEALRKILQISPRTSPLRKKLGKKDTSFKEDNLETPELLKSPPHSQAPLRARFGEWVLFGSKPYVYPKIRGVEIPAPFWFKYLGRLLLGLILAFLITQQRNIWMLFRYTYESMLELTRAGMERSHFHESPPQHLHKIQMDIRALLTYYGSIWRRIFLYATSAPFTWMGWRLVLEPGASFWTVLAKTRRLLARRWESGLLTSAILIGLLTGFFTAIQPWLLGAFYRCTLPMLLSGLFIFIMHQFVGLRPPRLQNNWLWLMLPLHVLLALLFFFLAMGVGNMEHTSQQFIWFLCQVTALAFPAVYLFGGARYEGEDDQEDDPDAPDSRREVRHLLLGQLAHIPYRDWVVSALVYRLHSVRSEVLTLILVLPSYLINSVFWLRGVVTTIEQRRRWTLATLGRASIAWTLFFFLSLVFAAIYDALQTHQVPSIDTLIFLALLLPALLSWGSDVLVGKWMTRKEAQPSIKQQLLRDRIAVSMSLVLSFLVVLGMHLLRGLEASWAEMLNMLLYIPIALPWFTLFAIWERRSERISATSNNPMERDELSSPSTSTNIGVKLGDSLLNRFQNLLQDLEQWLQTKTYQVAAALGRTDKQTREVMIDVLVEILANSQKALINGRWYLEEERELARVYQEWLVHNQEAHDPTLAACEMADYFSRVLDLFGSLLYDLSLPSRNKYLLYSPSREHVLTAIEKTLLLAHSPHEDMPDTLAALRALMIFLLEHSPIPPKDDQERVLIFRIIGLIGGKDSFDWMRQFLQSNEGKRLKKELLRACRGEPKLAELLFEERQKAEDPELRQAIEESLLPLRLPTPIALAYRHFLNAQTQEQQYRDKLQHPELDEEDLWALDVRHDPGRLHIERRRLECMKLWEESKSQLWDQMRDLYHGTCGYLLSSLKELAGSRVPQILVLGWENSQELMRTRQVLEEQEWQNFSERLLFSLFSRFHNLQDAVGFDNHTPPRNPREITRLTRLLSQKHLSLIEGGIDQLPLVWRRPMQNTIAQVLWMSEIPSIQFFPLHEPPPLPSDAITLTRGLRWDLHNTFQPLDSYSYRWGIEWLERLAHADALLKPDAETPIEPSEETPIPPLPPLPRVRRLAHAFSQLPAPHAAEDRAHAGRIFDRIWSRLHLLEELQIEQRQAVRGNDLLNFDAACTLLENFLQKHKQRQVEHLLDLLEAKLVPSLNFAYLQREDDTLAWYRKHEPRETLVTIKTHPLHAEENPNEQRIPTPDEPFQEYLPFTLDQLPALSATHTHQE